MGNSYKKTPIMGHASSRLQKRFKQHEHRAERKEIKSKLKAGEYDSLPDPKEYGNEWASPRDGKSWFGNLKNNISFLLDYKKWMGK